MPSWRPIAAEEMTQEALMRKHKHKKRVIGVFFTVLTVGSYAFSMYTMKQQDFSDIDEMAMLERQQAEHRLAKKKYTNGE